MIRIFRLTSPLLVGLLIGVVLLTGCGGSADVPASTTVPQAVVSAATSAPAVDAAATATRGPTPDMSSSATSSPMTAMDATATPAPSAAPAETATVSSGSQPAASAVEVKATLREWGLDLSKTEVAAGPVHFVINNTGMMSHNFTIKDSSGVLAKTVNFPSGSTQVLDVTLQPGTYTVYCSLPGHAARGRQNTLVVK